MIRVMMQVGATAILLAACGPSPAGSPIDCSPERDGELYVSYQLLWSGHSTGAETDVLVQNGGPFLFVDDRCRYWAYTPDRSRERTQYWASVRTGSLTASDVEDLDRAFSRVDWSRLDGYVHTGADMLSDAGGLMISREGRIAYCTPNCSDADDGIRRVVDALADALPALYERGEDVSGAVRVWVYADPAPDTDEMREWTGTDLSSFTMRAPREYPLVEGPDAELFRSHRDAVRDLEPWYRYIPMRSAGVFYRVVVRDALPFEGPDGRVQLD